MIGMNALVEHIDRPGIDGDLAADIKKLKPDITEAEALAVQLAVKRKHVTNGDRIVGHQASFTSSAVRNLFPDSPHPMVGTLLESITRPDGDEVDLDTDLVVIECEIALLLGRDLEGSGLLPSDVLRATDAFLPAIEVAPLRFTSGPRCSWMHQIAVQKAKGGYVVFGSKFTPARGIDPRLEGCLVSIDGQPRASACGFEAMGNPLSVVAAMAAKLAEIGEKLHAGQFIMTGSVTPPQRVKRGNDRVAFLQFATLGGVTVRLR